MSDAPVRSTIYLDPSLHQALRMKAAVQHRSMSEIVNEAVRSALREDQEDLAAAVGQIEEFDRNAGAKNGDARRQARPTAGARPFW